MPDLLSLLTDLLSGDEGRAEAAVPALTALGNDALPALREAARLKDPDLRWWALRALCEMPGVEPAELAAFLTDPEPAIRQAAALGLTAHPSESILPHLLRALHDTDPLTAGLARQALVKAGGTAVPLLLEALKEDRQEVRILALRALAEIKDHRAIPAMLSILSEDSALLGYWAQEGLERLGLNMVYIKPT